MPNPRKHDPIRSIIQSLGEQIGQEFASAISHSFNAAVGRNGLANSSLAGRGRLSASAGSAGCRVQGCSRKKAAKGLCQNHYAKARKLGMNLESLTASQLGQLGADGRSLRFANSAGSARSNAVCSVPGCARRHAARGLCMPHYAKANRLKMNTSSLSAGDMQTLATDLRGARA
jgi:hypothetical protein